MAPSPGLERRTPITALGSLLLAALACGARTPIDLLAAAPERAPGDAGEAGDSSISPFDASRPFLDAGGADAAADGSPTPEAATDGPIDASPDVVRPPPVTCADAPGLQPGSPWPIAHRCSARGGSSEVLGPAAAPTTVVWQAFTDAGWSTDVTVAADGTLYAYDGEVVALLPDGGTRWTAAIPATSSLVHFAIGADGTVYAWNGTLTALAPDGTTRWSATITSESADFGLAVGPDGTIYGAGIETQHGVLQANVTAVSAQGAALWTAWLGAAEPYSSPAVGSDGTVYLVVATPAGTVLDALTPQGQVAWSAPLTGTSGGTPGGPVVIADDGTLYASCAVGVCTFQPGGQPGPSFGNGALAKQIVLAPAAGLVYVSDIGTSAVAFAADGGLAWSYGSASPNDLALTLADGRGTAYLDGTQFGPAPTTALSPDGAVAWTTSYVPLALAADGTVVALSPDFLTMVGLRP